MRVVTSKPNSFDKIASSISADFFAESNGHNNISEKPAALIALIQGAVAVTEAQLAGNVVTVEVTLTLIVEIAVTVVVSAPDTVVVVVPATKLYPH